MRMSEALAGVLRFVRDWKACYLVRNRGALQEYGWWDSHKVKAVIDGKGRPIPWITYPCLEFIEDRIRKDIEVFEYGCGNSTLWWAARTKSVISCEHDRQWYDKLIGDLPANVSLLHRDLVYGGQYCQTIAQFTRRFDVVVIDGRDRVRCALNSVAALKEDGVIIWDNSERVEYSEGFKYLETAGFKRIDFWGMGPIDPSRWCTTVLYRRDNCLSI